MKKIISQFETDWLASHPVFYNTKTSKAGYNINDVIDFSDIELHPEGFNNYLDFGYSVFEQTPVKNVKFMRYSSILRIYDDNSLEVEYLPDPADNCFGKTTNENDVLDLIKEKVSKWENNVKGEIVLPLSGGFDSRLLVSMISDKSRLRCFTYGISPNQAKSYEVINAVEIAKILHFKWQQIELGDFHNYFDHWNTLFGVSTHAHGMYHIEFYKKILQEYTGSMNFLSGIFGDVWAGNVKKTTIDSFQDIYKLGYTHGLTASSVYSLLPNDNAIMQSFYYEYKEKLQFDFYQIITIIRLKIILISYLVSVPESFGFSVFSPYLDMDVALSMLCLPEARRKNRQWQKDYFKSVKLDIENMALKKSFTNTLDFYAAQKVRIPPLKYKYYTPFIQQNYIEDINNIYKEHYPLFEKWLDTILEYISVSVLCRRLRIPGIINKFRRLFRELKEGGVGGYYQLFIKRYYAYLTLKPFEYLFKQYYDN